MTRSERRARPVLVALLFAVAAIAAACGDDGPTDADARKVGQAALTDSELDVDEDVEICIGRSLIADLGEEEAANAVGETEIDELPDDQREAAVAALNECVPGEVVAAGMVEAFLGGAGADGEASTELVDCLSEELDGKVGDVFEEGSSADDGDQAFLDMLEPCPTDELVMAGLTTGLEQSGMSPEVIECVTGELEGQLDLGDLVAEDPAAQAAIEAAVGKCSAGSTGGA